MQGEELSVPEFSYTPDPERILEQNRIRTGLEAACKILDQRSGVTNSWSFSPHTSAASFCRWRDTLQTSSQFPQETAHLNGLLEATVDPKRLALVTTPHVFDTTVRTLQLLYRTLAAAGDFGNREEDLIFAYAEGKVETDFLESSLKELHRRWESVIPLQLTEDVAADKREKAESIFSRPARYEMYKDPETGLFIFWDNAHLLKQYVRHKVRLSYSPDDHSGSFGLRHNHEEITELTHWLESEDGAPYRAYQKLLEAAKRNSALWDKLCYRVWLHRDILHTLGDAGTAFQVMSSYFSAFEDNLTEAARRRFQTMRSIPHLIYLAAESISWKHQDLSAGADVTASFLGIQDGLTRSELMCPTITRSQPEATARFARSPIRTWMHEQSYLLTGAMLSTDYGFGHRTNSGPQEGILHEMEIGFEELQLGQLNTAVLSHPPQRRAPTTLSLPARFYPPRDVFSFDYGKDDAAGILLEQLGLRYFVDDNGELFYLKDILPGLEKIPLTPHGTVDVDALPLSPQQKGILRIYAVTRGALALYAYFWNQADTGFAKQLWGDPDAPGREFVEKLKDLGLKISYPDSEKVAAEAKLENDIRSAARTNLGYE